MKLFSEFTTDARNINGNYLAHKCRTCAAQYWAKRHPKENRKTKDQIVTDTHKSCSCCGAMKLFSEFHKDKKNVKGKGLCTHCKECANARSRQYNADRYDDQDYRRLKKQAYVKTRYGISLSEYEGLLSEQGNSCAICKIHLPPSGFFTHLDHDHSTGKIRNFLCTNCNRGLGHFQDSQDFLMAAIEYLKAHTDDGNQKEGSCL